MVINVLIANNTGMELTLDVESRTFGTRWRTGVQDVGQTIGARLEATLEGPDDQPFNAELRFSYPEALRVAGSFSMQVNMTLGNGTEADVRPQTNQTRLGTVSVATTSYRPENRPWQVVFIVQPIQSA